MLTVVIVLSNRWPLDEDEDEERPRMIICLAWSNTHGPLLPYILDSIISKAFSFSRSHYFFIKLKKKNSFTRKTYEIRNFLCIILFLQWINYFNSCVVFVCFHSKRNKRSNYRRVVVFRFFARISFNYYNFIEFLLYSSISKKKINNHRYCLKIWMIVNFLNSKY